MKRAFLFLMFMSLVFLGMQDMMSIKTSETRGMPQETEISAPADTHAGIRLTQPGRLQTCFYNGNSEYIRVLNRISQGDEDIQASTEQLRLFHKLISASYLKSFNSKQKTSELAFSFATMTHSALQYRFAHLIYLLRRIVI